MLGWLALVDHHYTEASVYFEAGIESLPYDGESIAWSQASLARATLGLGHRDEARKLLTEALSTSFDIQGYIPMVFTLPMTLPILVEEDVELAVHVYQQVKSDPFLAKAPLFEDLVYQDLPDEISWPEVEIEGGSERQDALWGTAKLILEKWTKDEQIHRLTASGQY